MLKKIQGEGSVRDLGTKELFHFILAYADDMLFIAHTTEDLLALLYLINILAIKICLKFNPKKYTTLYYSSKPPAGCRDTIFILAGSELPHMFNGNSTMFLGKPIGVFLPRDSVTADRLKQRGMKIFFSMFTPWQRIDCIKIFFTHHCYS